MRNNKFIFMKREIFLQEALKSMQEEKGKICLSIVVPTHRLSDERRVDELEVNKALDKARQFLEYKYPEPEIKPLLQSLDELYKEIDFVHNTEGLGLYVSPDLKYIVHYPFPVEEKVIAGDTFEIRDLLYKLNYSKTYFVLLLSEKTIQLFEGAWKDLHEIGDINFPMEYEETYSYNIPSRSSTLAGSAHVKSFEKDKSELEEIRFTDYFRRADVLLDEYMPGITPLIVMAPQKELSWFENISKHKNQIIHKIAGNYHYSNRTEIAEIAWSAMRKHLDNEREILIKEFVEKIGEHRGVSGLQNVWNAAREGNALKLLVEKDFRKPGFVLLLSGADRLYVRPPKKPHKILADAVDDIIELVLKKNGKVYFVDNGKLKDYKHIALITRYHAKD
jgi:hypothetical protein